MKFNPKIIGGATACAVIALLLVIALNRNKTDSGEFAAGSQSDSTQRAETAELPSANQGDVRLPETIVSGVFVMKASVSDASGTNGDFIIDFVGEDEFQLSGVFDGQQIAYVVSNGFAYINNGGEWARTSASGIESLFSIEDLTLSTDDYEQFKNAAQYIGNEECGGVYCDVWEADIDAEDGGSNYAKIYVSEGSRQVLRIEAETADGSQATITYDYDTRPSVRPPSDFTDLNLFGL